MSEPFSSAVCFQPAAVLVNTYARPAVLGVDRCTHDGGRARDGHREAELIAGDGVGALQLGGLLPAASVVLVNTYARPACFAWNGAPTTAVVPEMATEEPK